MNPYVSFISNSSLFISTMSVSLSLYYTVITASTINYSRLIVVFFGTLTSYIGVQLIPISKNKIINQRTEWIKKHKLILISLMVISFIVITLSIKNLNSFDILNFIHLFILVLFYEKIFINKYELRKLPYFKPVIIAYI